MNAKHLFTPVGVNQTGGMNEETRKLAVVLGRNLRRARLDKGITLEGLAIDVEMSPDLIYRIEKGEYNIWMTQLGRLSACLGERPSDLFNETA